MMQSPVVLRALQKRRRRRRARSLRVLLLLPLLLLLLSPPQVELFSPRSPALPAAAPLAPPPIAAAGVQAHSPTPTDEIPRLPGKAAPGTAPSVDKPPNSVENHVPIVENIPPGSPLTTERRATVLPTVTPSPTSSPCPTPTTTPASLSTPTPTPTEARRLLSADHIPTPRQLPSIGLPPEAGASSAAQQPALPPASLPAAPAGTPLPTFAPGTVRSVPIVMYHYVREVDPNTDPLGYRLSVAPDMFAAHLDWLAQEGYTPIRMDQVAGCLQGYHGCPARPVALTFDDGYADAYTTVFPLLQQHGFVATFYVVNSFVGAESYMTWEQVGAMHAAGMEIGGHTSHHYDLTTLGSALATEEIAGAKQQLETMLQAPAWSFCYPVGKYTAETQRIVEEAGYLSAVTTVQSGYYGNMYALPRIRIDGSYSLAGFASLVQAYTP